MTLSPADFVARWRKSTLTERSGSQSHFIDLCDMLGQPRPADDDQQGTRYTFEKGAAKSGGGEGWADVWKRNFFAWEYKGKHKDLAAAYRQLLQYREDLDNPPLLVVCDFERFEVHTNFTNTAKRVFAFSLDDLLSADPLPDSRLTALEVLRALFTQPERLRPDRTSEEVTEAAASEFARLSESLARRGHDPERAAHFLMRLLFCLFAEDIGGLLPNRLFTRLLENTRTDPEACNALVRQLFGTMAHGGFFGTDRVPHFNGGLFNDDAALDLTAGDIEVLLRAARLDWASIEPAIFGTLFERSLDPSKRSQLGAHYTSRDDILLIVEPVLMEPLRRRWTQVQEQARAIVNKREATPDRGARTRYNADLAKLLLDFMDEIARVRVLDPACGSGNFLYVALKRLLDLQKEVSVFASNSGLSRMMPNADPSQLYGIEVNPYAFELASVVVWIGYIQWMHDNGFPGTTSPVLKPLHNIKHMDAILAYDEQDRPIEPQWPEADVIIGNPPFLGGNKIRQQLGDDYVNTLFKLYEGRVPAFADLVCYWFERAREQIEKGCAKRAGLLATQGIRGGANRKVLERIKQTGDIFWAQSDRDWVLDGANVHVSMVGFDPGIEPARSLDNQVVISINPNLTAAADLTAARRLVENANTSFQGPSPKAPFDISAEKASVLLNAPVNINGQPNRDVVRPVVSAIDLVGRRRDEWTIDFGSLPHDLAAEYEAPFEYVRQNVYPVRMQERKVQYAGNWWQYARPRTEMRRALEGKSRYIATPRVSKHRIFVWLSPDVLANDGTIVFARDDDYFFGVLHSKLHELWALRMGTALEDRPRYTPTTTFETFPFPWPPGKEPLDDPRVQAIAQAARELVDKRDRWLNPEDATEAVLKKRTLTNLYNERPTWLQLAHQKLDEAVLDAYGWPHDLSDEQILERLLERNLSRNYEC